MTRSKTIKFYLDQCQEVDPLRSNIKYLKPLYMQKNKIYEQFGPVYIYKQSITKTNLRKIIESRLKAIRQFPRHQNICQLLAFDIQQQKIQRIQKIFHSSSNLYEVMKQHIENRSQLKLSTIASMFYQIVQALKQLGQQRISHLRLIPSSILAKIVKQHQEANNDQNITREKLAVQICDFGIYLQKQKQQNKRFLHPQVNQSIYLKPYQQTFKYDLWSLGTLIYVFSEFKYPKYVQKSNKWLSENSIKNKNFKKIIQKCCSDCQQKLYKSWSEVQKDIQQQSQIQESQKVSTQTALCNHLRLIFLVSSIYILAYKNNDQSWDCEYYIGQLARKLLVFIYILHFKIFKKQCFQVKCYTLGQQTLKTLEVIEKFLQNEKFAQKNLIHSKEWKKQIRELLSQMKTPLTKMLMQQQQQVERYQQFIILKGFSKQFVKIINTIQKQLSINHWSYYFIADKFQKNQQLQKMAYQQFGYNQGRFIDNLERLKL